MKKKNVINDILSQMRRTGQMLSETYVFDEESPEADMRPMGDEGYGDVQPYEDEETVKKMEHTQAVIQQEPIIAKIRETAIEGLRKYADNPLSPTYEFFKKVFLESDKVLTNTGNKK